MTKSLIPKLQHFYRTSAQPCPYVDGLSERKLITELSAAGAVPLYDELSRAGFRRSHRIAYRPACTECSACRPVRIVAARYRSTRSARRLSQINQDLVVETLELRATVEQFRLFARYQRARHGDSDMAAMGYGDYRAMIEDSPLDTVLIAARERYSGRLMAVCLTDDLDDGCSAVYSFFEPEEPDRSLGTWLVQQLIERTQQRRLPYVYLGYWIAGSPKMDYKIRFRPLEALGIAGWAPVGADAPS